jgi:c-di-GMP-binding flagellar brake protein YcgR
MRLPVRLSVASAFRETSRAQRRVFRSLSQNISIHGIQVIAQDKALFGLEMSCRLRLEIVMPKHSGVINCMGALRNIAKRKEGQDLRYLCVEFIELPQSQRKRLERLCVN